MWSIVGTAIHKCGLLPLCLVVQLLVELLSYNMSLHPACIGYDVIHTYMLLVGVYALTGGH